MAGTLRPLAGDSSFKVTVVAPFAVVGLGK
jgi:hypothetical protein